MNDPLYMREPFTKWHAWCDLIMSAYFAPAEFFVRGIKVKAKRGCVYIGVLELAERWKWSRGKVERFLKYLAEDKRISIHRNNVVSCITILNYEKYQQNEPTVGENEGATDIDDNSHPENQSELLQQLLEQMQDLKGRLEVQEKKSEEEKNPETPKKKKKSHDAAPKSLEEKKAAMEVRSKAFYETLIPYVVSRGGQYPKEMIRAFYDYWSEPDKSFTKMRFEKAETWEVGRRLATWASRENQFDNKNGRANRQSDSAEQTTLAAASAVARLLEQND